MDEIFITKTVYIQSYSKYIFFKYNKNSNKGFIPTSCKRFGCVTHGVSYDKLRYIYHVSSYNLISVECYI